jgi:hypothetical protein
MLTTDLRSLMLELITKFNFHKTLSGTVIWNSQACGSSYYCPNAYLAPANIRRELFRQSSSLLSWLTGQGEWIEILSTVVTVWGTYAIFSGSLSLMVRLRTLCGKKTEKYNCCTILISLFSEFDAALNPNALIKTDYKYRVMEMSSEILHLHNATNTLRESIIELKTGMDLKITRLVEKNEQQEAEINLYARLIQTPDPDSQKEQHLYATMKHHIDLSDQLEMISARLKIDPPMYDKSQVMLNMDLSSVASRLHPAVSPSGTSDSAASVQLSRAEPAAAPARQTGQLPHPRPHFGLRHLMYQPSPEAMKRIIHLHTVSHPTPTNESTPPATPPCSPESSLPSPPPTPPPRPC